MLNYIIKRLLMLIPVLVGVSLLAFSIIHLIPGDPARIILGERATEASILALQEKLGLNQPLYIQFLTFLKNILKGDLGTSIITNEKVSYELLTSFAATLELTFVAMIIAIVVGIAAGTIAAIRQYSIFDNISMIGALVGVSMPIFWLGLLMIWAFAYKLGWFPASGRLDVALNVPRITHILLIDSLLNGNFQAFKNTLWHLAMPSLALATIPMAIIARMTRSSMLEVMKQDYIRTARAKGLPEKIIIFKHAIKNAFLPVITVIGLQVGLLLGGAVMTETVFSYPGLGRRLYIAIMARDYPVVQGGILLISVCFVLVNLIVDLTYSFIDPRIKLD
ncbi:MAG: peptide/nickel transport system permease protein [Clostridia bacterium]|nr:peptide/nickel transport system permease protein [Clostridia bacterium]MDN5322992.1 peptide/nickel transport system permease protein [Clostridia bacterium]